MNGLAPQFAVPQSADDIKQIRFSEYCYVLDLLQDAQLVTYRAPEAYGERGVTLRERMSYAELQAIRSYAMSYDPRPLLCRAGGSLAVLLPTLTPTATVGILLFPFMEEHRFLALSKQHPTLWRYADGVRTEGLRISAKTKEYEPEYEEIVLRCCSAMEWIDSFDPAQDGVAFLEERVKRLAAFCGTPAELTVMGAMEALSSSEISLLCAFLLPIFLLARRATLLREVNVCLSWNAYGCYATANLPTAEKIPLYAPELMHLDALANRKDILFEAYQNKGVLMTQMQITLPDWSYLGLKQKETISDVVDALYKMEKDKKKQP